MTSPLSIDPESIFDREAVETTLGIAESTLRAARKSGRLKFMKLGHRVLYKGCWLLEWIEANTAQAVA